MTYAIRGKVTNSATNAALSSVKVEFALDVGLEYEPRPGAGSGGTSGEGALPPWTALTNDAGLFLIPLTDDDVETILGGRKHRELVFRVYDASGVVIGTQTAYVTLSTLLGTRTISLTANPTYTPYATAPMFTVSGFVTKVDGTPLSGKAIALTKKNLRPPDSSLGSATSGTDGRFMIRYPGTAGGHADNADFPIYLTATSIGATAGHFCNPPTDLTVRLVENNGVYVGQSDYDLDYRVISPLLGTATVASLTVSEVEFLMCRTQHDGGSLAHLVRAHVLKDLWGLPAEAFVAFAHAGIPLATNVLTGLTSAQITDAINRAIAVNAVPASLATSLATIISTLGAARIDRLVPSASPGSTSLGAVLVAASLTPGLPRQFAVEYAAHTGTTAQFWANLRANPSFGSPVVDKIQFTLQAGAITANYAPLVKLLHAKRDANLFKHAAELAQFTEAQWAGFLTETVDGNTVTAPAGVAGTTSSARRANYAAAITKMVEDIYPSAHLAYRVPATTITTSVTNFSKFVVDNPGFSFQRTNISEFFTTANGLPALPADKDALKQDLLKVQRVSAITPRYGRTAASTALLSGGVTSAGQIQRMGFAAFKTKFNSSMDASTLATTYDKADQVASAALHAFMHMRPEMHFPQTDVITSPGCGDVELETLFGNLDYCACGHCDSVYGPAAYFVDIMQYLRQRDVGEETALDVLLRRRPELAHVLLNCENSNTAMPTIDLVNEVLERRAAEHYETAVMPWPQTTWSTSDLVAQPEHVDNNVYAKLADEDIAYFPHGLPFDLPLEDARAHLRSLGAPRIALQDALEWFTGLGEDQVLRVDERLGLSPGQGRIVRAVPGTPSLFRLWGFTSEAGWLGQINKVEMFLERSELDLPALQALLRARIFGGVEIEFAEPCTLKDARFVNSGNPVLDGLTSQRLIQLKIFLRLRRALGWTAQELDATLQGLDTWFDDPTADLQKIARFVRVRQRFPQLPHGEVLSWFALLDRRVYNEGEPSYYDVVVRPRTRDAVFTDLDGSVQFNAVHGDLLGILQTDDEGLAAAYAATGLSGTSPLAQANLSRLYRVASIARALELSIPELVTLTHYTQTLNESDPFAGTADAPVRALLDLAEAVQSSGFSVAELDWVLRNQQPEKFSASDLDITRVFIGLITALQQADADHLQSLPNDVDPLDRVERLLAGPLPAPKVAEAMAFIRKETPGVIDPAALRGELLYFLTAPSPAVTEFDKAFGIALAPGARAEILEPELVAWLRRQKLERLVIQQLASDLALETADCEDLLRAYAVGPLTALELLTAGDFFAEASFDPDVDAVKVKEPWFPAAFLERAGVEPLVTVYVGLRKVALVAAKFRFAPGLLRWLLEHGGDTEIDVLDLTNLPQGTGDDEAVYDAYAGWDWLRRAIRVRDEVLLDPSTLTLLLGELFIPSGTFDKADALAVLAEVAGWDLVTLQAFEANDVVTRIELKGLEAVEAFHAAFTLSSRLGVQPETVRTWAKATALVASHAAAIRGAAEAKFGPIAWPGVAQPLRDRLRERQRDALVDLLVHEISGVSDRNDLFGELLMDVDIACCNRSTRILFATAAVQLFVQRALMGLEEDVELTDLDADEWEWMKRYRVWEANRKIFLYPENWVLPELRTDKTPLFKKLEEELAQSEADAGSVEKAYVHYLEGLQEVARLDVCGMFHELEQDGIVVVDRMHVFACTRGNPFKVFYRQREDDSYWTAWEEVPFPVESRNLVPAMANRRLMLIWPRIEVRSTDTNVPQAGAKPNKVRKVRLSWAELKDGQWSGISTTDASLQLAEADELYPDAGVEGQHPNREVFLTTQIAGGVLQVRLGRIDEEGGAQFAKTAGYFAYNPCTGTFDAIADYSSESATLAWSLDGLYPVPSGAMSWRQGYIQYDAGFPHDVFPELDYVKLPLYNAPGQYFSYSPNILKHPSKYKLAIPRQEHILNGERPFVYSDAETILYIRRGEADEYTVDAKGDAQALHTTGSLSLMPYFAYTNGKVQATAAPANSSLGKQISGGDSPATQNQWGPDGEKSNGAVIKYGVSLFYHPYACLFLQQVRRFGPIGLLDPDVATLDDDSSLLYQQASENLPSSYFADIDAVHKPVPKVDIDFRFGGAYSVYNWELFFHIPLYIADRLMSERRFAEAQRWLGYIFNPIRRPSSVGESDCKHYWRIKPFRQQSATMSIAALMELLHYTGNDADLKDKKADLKNQIAHWRKDPFLPHDVARLRPTAYMRSVVMKYLDNLIAWGDDLFRQDTRESTQEAVQLYFLALQILGKRPRRIEGDERPDKTYEEAYNDLDGFSNFLVTLENDVIGFGPKDAFVALDFKAQADWQYNNPTNFKLGYVIPPNADNLLVGAPKALTYKPKPPFNPIPQDSGDASETRLYFCIPPNDKLLGYWDTVGDRLFKLRNCLNLEGVRRDLALFDPPIDPGLLAKAAAQGIDIGTAVSNLYAPLPHYRFLPHLGIAKDFAAQVSGLGNALLQALEKRDAEALAVLRGGHEVGLLKVIRKVKEKAIEEARDNIAALERSKEVAQKRESYYKSRKRMNALEILELSTTVVGTVLDAVGSALMITGAVAAAVPNFTAGISGMTGSPVATLTIGGTQIAKPAALASQGISIAAGVLHRLAGVFGTQASYTRRKEEWDFQAELATAEIAQIDAQITAANVRKAMAEYELGNHDKQVEQSVEVLEYMQSKFTNAELYSWMAAELSKVYHLAYQLAIDLSRRAERCYRYELAIPGGDDFVQFGHWDNRRQGLLAGERLQHDLRRMEAAYYQNNRREYELTKRVSLASLDPVALIALRKTGACHFNLPSIAFNLDHASHFLRRIKLVGVSMPAVTGPYTNVGVTLTYESGEIRRAAGGGLVADVGTAQSVAISVSQEDTGLFEPNLRDERYLPFEGRALENSNWRLELPAKVRQFDYETISDVILTVRYTAREGGSETSGVVGDLLDATDAGLNTFKRADADTELERGVGQVQVFSARAEYPEAWRSFIADGHQDNATELVLDLGEQRFPDPQVPPGGREVDFVAVFVRWPADENIAPASGALTGAALQPPIGADLPLGFGKYKENSPVLAGGAKYDYLWFAATAAGLGKTTGQWKLKVPGGWPEQKSPEDVVFVVAHKVS